jgi:hypothetical protein
MYYIYTRKHHKEENSFWGRIPRESSIKGSSPEWKLPFPLMSKGEIFIRCMERESYAWRERTES